MSPNTIHCFVLEISVANTNLDRERVILPLCDRGFWEKMNELNCVVAVPLLLP